MGVIDGEFVTTGDIGSAKALTGCLFESAPSHNLTNGSIPCSPVEITALAEFPLFLVHWYWLGLVPCLHNFGECPVFPHLVQNLVRVQHTFSLWPPPHL